MKIVRIIARLNVGGPARHVVWLTQALQDREFESTLVAGTIPPGEDDMGYFADAAGVKPVYLREMSREISPLDIIAALKLYRIFRTEKPDIVHTHTAKAGAVGRLAAFFYRWLTLKTFIGQPRPLRVVHTYHGHIFHSYYGKLKTLFFLAIERLLARGTDRIIVLSDQQLDEINSKFRVGQTRQFQIVPLGIDMGPFTLSDELRKKVRGELNAAENDIIIGFVGRLTEIKNVSLLLKVAAGLRDEPRVKFVIVGDGNLRENLKAESNSLGLAQKVLFLGNRIDIGEIYNALDIVALSSLNEGTPLSIIEAMGAGRAVISTAVGGVPGLLGDVIESVDGFAVCYRGVRVDSFETGDYIRGLNHLLENAALRAEMGTNGAEYIRSNYSRERLIADIKTLYRALTTNNIKSPKQAE
jgi:glycosyltransferase involved in cell wall biosynthesis